MQWNWKYTDAVFTNINENVETLHLLKGKDPSRQSLFVQSPERKWEGGGDDTIPVRQAGTIVPPTPPPPTTL